MLLFFAAMPLGLMPLEKVHAIDTTFTVNNIGDASDANAGDGTCATAGAVCTLRAAIEEANANAGADKINFNIAGSGPHVIKPTTQLPAITDPLTINGFSQSGSSANTVSAQNRGAANTILKVAIDGSLLSNNSKGFVLTGGSSTIKGLNIQKFAAIAIDIQSNNNKVEGNFIGTSIAGFSPAANGFGVRLRNASNNTIGGSAPESRNLISANNLVGILIESPTTTSTGNKVQGNSIGCNIGGNQTATMGNGYAGIGITGLSSDNLIGGSTTEQGNFIAGNKTNGGIGVMSLQANTPNDNSILGNLFVDNDNLGIDLLAGDANSMPSGNIGPTANDTNDADQGANGYLNSPQITDASIVNNMITIHYNLDIPDSNAGVSGYRLEFFGSPAASPNKTVQATSFATTINVAGDVNNGELRLPVPSSVSLPSDVYLTATATEIDTSTDGFGATSEISTPRIVTIAPLSPLSFADWYINTNSYSGSGSLLDLSGNGNDARIGLTSAQRAPIWNLGAANDPNPYFFSDGSIFTQITTPDTPALSIRGDLDIRTHFKPDNWIRDTDLPYPSTPGEVITKQDDPIIPPDYTDDESYETGFWGDGTAYMEWNDSVTNDEHVVNPDPENVPLREGSVAVENRWTLDVDNGNNQHEVKYYEISDDAIGEETNDGKVWDLKQTWVYEGTTDVIDSPGDLYVGGPPSQLVAKVYYAQVYNGIDGTLVADFNPGRDAGNTRSWTTPLSGETWNMSNDARIIYPNMGVSNDASLRLAPGRFLKVASNNTNSLNFENDFTMAFKYKPFSLFGFYFNKGQFPSQRLPHVPVAGYGLMNNNYTENPSVGQFFYASDGVSNMPIDSSGSNNLPVTYAKNTVIIRYKSNSRELEVFVNGQSNGPIVVPAGVTITNTNDLVFGNSRTAYDFYASAIWNQALSETQVQQVNDALAQ